MTPHYQDDWLTVYHGDCKAVMAEMEPESVHCVVTSPPYWGLRDYGEAGQLGLEPTPEEYVANLVAVFREVRRVLRADGTVWLNLGDSYAADAKGSGGTGKSGLRRDGRDEAQRIRSADGSITHQKFEPRRFALNSLKPKDLVGIPWRVAFALQADGWYLRSDIIWAKPNPMPESVTDRPTKSHEYIFLLSKSPRYFFDADAVREPHVRTWDETNGGNLKVGGTRAVGVGVEHAHGGGYPLPNPAGRNIRSVWTMATQPYPGAHFATFPETLPERCIKAGTSEKGVCPECGAPWQRVVERGPAMGRTPNDGNGYVKSLENHSLSRAAIVPNRHSSVETTGWQSSCSHDAEPHPATVLDPFAGSGTTGMVAQSLSRRAVLIDLSLDYLGQLMARNADIPLGLGA